MDQFSDPITIDQVFSHVRDEVFVFRPGAYAKDHPNWPGCVGLEVEMLPIIPSDSPQPLKLQTGPKSLSARMREMAVEQDWRLFEEKGSDGTQVLSRVQMSDGDNLSFEPGGQFEFSTIPYPCLSDAVVRIRDLQQKMDRELGALDAKMIQIGINPWHTVDELGLQLPKARYEAMDAYFREIGPWGPRMMRQTCTVQVCLDFGEGEASMAQRFLASQWLAPWATAIFAWSSFMDGAPSGVEGIRSRCWRRLDPSRTGIPDLKDLQSTMSKESCVQTYGDFLLDSNVIFVESLGYERPKKTLSFRQWLAEGYKGVFPTAKDLDTQLSLLFPEVRPRGFLELRSVDCQARPWQVVPAAFYTGLLYDSKKLGECLDLLAPFSGKLNSLMERSEEGGQMEGFAETAVRLFEIAMEGFCNLPECFRGEGTEAAMQAFYDHFTSRCRTPSTDLLDVLDGGKQLTWDTLMDLNESWAKLSGY